MTYRNLIEEDYDVLVEWWKFWRFPAPDRRMLPDYGKGGIIVFDEENRPICAGFYYHTNSDITWIEFIVANPLQTKENRENGLLFLIEKLKYICKEYGYVLAFSSIKNENLLNKMVQSGFKIGTKNTNEIVCNLWEQ